MGREETPQRNGRMAGRKKGGREGRRDWLVGREGGGRKAWICLLREIFICALFCRKAPAWSDFTGCVHDGPARPIRRASGPSRQ